jgi:glycosyltransferase involved in cell wall biosynthesis
MRIGLNATCLNERPSGAKQRFQGIYGAVIRKLPDVEFVVYEPADCGVGGWFPAAANVEVRRTPVPSEGRFAKMIRGATFWELGLRGEELDVFECFNEPLVRCPTGRTLTTIHDIRRIREDCGFVERQLFSLSLRRTLNAADLVITVSQAMKSELLSFDPTARVEVVYNGIDAEKFSCVSDQGTEQVRSKFALPSEFLLSVGHFEPRKNYLRLVDAIALLRDRGSDVHLVIVGNDSGERQAVAERICARNLHSHITLLSGLSDVEVRSIYRMSSLLVFPSLYEGFGIPLLEGMAAGVPLVMSDIPVFREITEDRGFYFPATSSEAMAHVIDSAMGAQENRQRAVEYGRERIRDFSFEQIAETMISIYRKTC